MTSIFEGQPPQNKAFSHQNKGHLGSRYIYTLKKPTSLPTSAKWLSVPRFGYRDADETTVRCNPHLGVTHSRVTVFSSVKQQTQKNANSIIHTDWWKLGILIFGVDYYPHIRSKNPHIKATNQGFEHCV